MRSLLLLFLAMPFFAPAQDTTAKKAPECKLRRMTDPYTRETRLSTGFLKLSGGSVTIDADSKEIDVLFTIDGLDKCYDNNSTAAIYFEGVKTKMNNRNGGTMNCEGLFHFIFKNTALPQTPLQKMMTQRINSIVFVGNNKAESKITLSPENQERLMAIATCLVEEAKKLIQ